MTDLRTNQRQKYRVSLLLMLCGFAGLWGCDDKTAPDAQQAVEYAVEKPFYQGPTRVVVRLRDDRVSLSGLLEMELTAATDPDYTVQFPDVAQTLEQFTLHSSQELSETLSEAGKIVHTVQYQLEPLELGTCEIPSLTFSVKRTSPGDQDADVSPAELTTEPLQVDVFTSLSADPNALALGDIEDVVEVKANLTWLWITAAVLFLLAVGVAIGMAMRPKRPVQVKRTYKPAHEIAFEVLRAIAGEKLVEQGRVKEFYGKLSTCLRQYIENRFQLRAPEQTTEEFLEQLKRSDTLQPEHKQQLEKFLQHCDLVKFARYQPSTDQINESLTMAEEFVEKTKSPEHMVDVTNAPQAERQVG